MVDGYNVLYAGEAYLGLVDEMPPKVGRLSTDPFDRARERLLADVAAFAQGSYEAVIVYDGASNPSPERPERQAGGVRIAFSRAGRSADSVIEALVTEARDAGREVTVVTSDGTIRATTFGPGVSFLASDTLVREVDSLNAERDREEVFRPGVRMALEDRLPPDVRAKLERLTGRQRDPGSGHGR